MLLKTLFAILLNFISKICLVVALNYSAARYEEKPAVTHPISPLNIQCAVKCLDAADCLSFYVASDVCVLMTTWMKKPQQAESYFGKYNIRLFCLKHILLTEKATGLDRARMPLTFTRTQSDTQTVTALADYRINTN